MPLNWRRQMKKKNFHWLQNLLFAVLFFLPTTSFAEDIYGGLTFLGDRQNICIEIAGECTKEDITFELDTCNASDEEKEKFKNRMPFTILVPKGNHKMVIRRDGKKILADDITIKPEEVLEYQLPKH